MGKRMHVIVRVSDRCNQDCSYCYVDRDTRLHSKIALKPEDLHSLYKLVLGSGYYDFVTFVWHGGEPTLIGHDNFSQILEMQKIYLQPNQSVQNSIQTNATVLDPEIINLFVKHNFQVGVSLDAPPEINNTFRVFWDGKPTLKRVISGIKDLQFAGLHPGGICVLTRQNYTKSFEIYEFFKELGMSYQFNPMYADEGVSECSAKALAITPDEYAKTLIETYDLYVNDPNPTIDVTDIQNIIASMMVGCSQNCLYAGKCEEFIGILPNGDVYLCDLFYKPDQKIGNLSDLNVKELTSSQVLITIGNRPEHLHLGECRGCEWWSICRGGCSSKSRAIFGDAMRKDPFCQTRKLLFSHVQRHLKMKGGEADEPSKATTSALGQSFKLA